MEEKKEKLVCYKCGSKNVEIEAWVDINTHKLTDIVENGEAYCIECERLTKPIDEKKFLKNKKEKIK